LNVYGVYVFEYEQKKAVKFTLLLFSLNLQAVPRILYLLSKLSNGCYKVIKGFVLSEGIRGTANFL